MRSTAPRLLVLGLAAAWPFLLGGEPALRRGTDVLVLVLLALSMTVTTGWLRTPALHAPASAGVGAAAAGLALSAGQSLPVAVLVAAGAGALVAVGPVAVLGDRRRGLVPLVTLTTTLLVWGLVLPTLRVVPFARPVVLGIDLGGGRALYLAALLLAGAAWVAVGNLSVSPVGRRARAVGADPSYAVAAGIDVRPAWLAMFAVSGTVAGLAGSILAVQSQGLPDLAMASPAMAVVVVGLALLGGVASPGGAVLGALVVGLAPVAVSGVPDPQLVVACLALAVVAAVPRARGGLAELVRLGRRGAEQRLRGAV
jgi:branched-chain amino acid transport system permease protein